MPGPQGFPLAKFQPGSVAGPGYSPFIQIDGSPVVYNAPIIATGNGPFDVVHHTNTEDRVLGIHIAPPAGAPGAAPQGQFFDSWADMLFVKGFDSGEPIIYLLAPEIVAVVGGLVWLEWCVWGCVGLSPGRLGFSRRPFGPFGTVGGVSGGGVGRGVMQRFGMLASGWVGRCRGCSGVVVVAMWVAGPSLWCRRGS